jgi:hypothetical protein
MSALIWMPTHSRCAGLEPEPQYNPASVVDVEATVLEVREIPQSKTSWNGIFLTVKTERETIEVYLGPSDFLKDFEIVFSRGDRLQVIGSRVRSGEGYIILAREVRRQERTLYLRSRTGEPNWPPRKKAT